MHVDATKRGEQCEGRAINPGSKKRRNNNSKCASISKQSRQSKEIENEDDPHPHPADALITTYFHRASDDNATRGKRNAAS